MKKQFLLLPLTLLSCTVFSQKPIELEDIYGNTKLTPKTVSGIVSMRDGEHYTTLESTKDGSCIVRHDYRTGQSMDTLLKQSDIKITDAGKDELAKSPFSGYSLSQDESSILITTLDESVYRRSKRSACYVYDLKTKSTRLLSKDGKCMYPSFSPDGSKVAFVRENNLFLVDLATGKERAITTDGVKNEIINGAVDWVYEEEFSMSQGFSWSPDGQRIAYYRFDESKVKEYSMDIYGDPYPKKETFKYPKAGEANSIVQVCIYDLAKSSSLKVPVNKDGSVTDQYIPRIQWTKDPLYLSIQRLNRKQNELELLIADARNGQSNVVLTEESSTYLEINDDLYFLDDKKHFVWCSESDGYAHLYLYNLSGQKEKQITKGSWDVSKVYGLNGNTLFYQSAEPSAMQRSVFSIKTDGSGKKTLSSRQGTNDAQFSNSFKYFINFNSTANSPAFITLHNGNDGKEIRTLESNEGMLSELKGFSISKKEFFRFKNTEGIELNGWMIKPLNFSADKKYPVLMMVYGGPGINIVNDSWDGKNYLWYQHLASKGYLIACVDARGTGYRGSEFRSCTYKQLGKLETADQIDAAKFLGSLPFVDNSRIGIWGWSYGGYMTAMCMTVGADVFKTGISVAPVCNWKNYDSVYSERYMDLPKNNEKGYTDGSPISYAEKLKGNFLLIHGTADDNVHYQNSMEIANALVKAGKQFSMFSYPNKNHGISGGNTRLHVYTQMTNFLLKNL